MRVRSVVVAVLAACVLSVPVAATGSAGAVVASANGGAHWTIPCRTRSTWRCRTAPSRSTLAGTRTAARAVSSSTSSSREARCSIDNGEGANAPPDQSSLVGFGDEAANEAFCNSPRLPRFGPWTCTGTSRWGPSEGRIRLQPV
jgi:hypothetical protein